LRPFEYAKPSSLSQLFDLLERFGKNARLLAGGTDVLVRLRPGHLRPNVVVDIKNIPGLGEGIVEVDSCLRVSALTTMTDLVNDSRIRSHFPALVEAANVVGSVQIRNRATLTGNICNASPAADTAPVLLAHRAIANLAARSGRRRVPLSDFFTGPGKTVLLPGEIVESIDLPISPQPEGAAFGRVTRRRGVDLATVNLCCLVNRAGETSFAYGAVGPRPFLVRDQSGILADPAAEPDAKRSVLLQMIAQAAPITDVRGGHDYRQAMLLVMSRRALESAIDRLRSAEEAA